MIGPAGAMNGLVVVSGCFALGSAAMALGLPRDMGRRPERSAAADPAYRRLLGRVRALTDSLAWAGIPLGGLIGGAAVASVGLVPALLTGGAAYFLTTNVAGLRPASREMDRSRAAARHRGGSSHARR